MSSDLQDILELSKDALSLHNLDSLEECTVKLDQIREKLINIDRGKLDSNIIWNLCGLIRGEMSKWTEGCKPPVASLEVSTQALLCLRNTFINCSKIQLMVAETDVLRDVILACVKWVFLSKLEQDSDITDNVDPPEDAEWQNKVSQHARASITCLGNLVAANTATRRMMWPYLLPFLCPMLKYPEEKVCYLSSMVIFNCLIEEELRRNLCSYSDIDVVICHLLTLYLGGKSNNENTLCFVLYSLEMILCCDKRVGSVWSSLSVNQQLLLLDILSNILEGKSASKCGTLSPPSITFLISVFKNETDKILRTHTSELEDNSAQVVARILSFLCIVAASEFWGPTLKEDKSLLITTVSLLQCMNNIGNAGGNDFSRMGLKEMANEEQLRKAESHPAYGFKRDLITLIASLGYRHKANQDQVRDMGGLTLILESSQFDAKNPGIKEASIYAIKALLEGNLENQQIVNSLEYRGSAENQEMQLSQVNGMVVVHGSSSLPNEENL